MRRWWTGAGLALAGAVLVGCTSSKGASNDAAEFRPSHARADALSAAGGAKAPAGEAGGATGGSVAQADNAANVPLGDGSAKIRVAQMTVDVRRGQVAAAADRAESIALGVGGDVDADDRTSGRDATASLRLRVPPEDLTSVLRQLSRLGREVSRQLSTTDVTERVADVNSRVASAQDSIARLRTLYANASKVGDVIAIEGELNQREADLESLQAQQRALQRQTEKATITLTLQTATKAAVPPKAKHHRSGFVGGLERGWHGFVVAARWVATAVGTLLPFLVLLAVLAVAGRLAWRRRPQPAPAPTPAPSE